MLWRCYSLSAAEKSDTCCTAKRLRQPQGAFFFVPSICFNVNVSFLQWSCSSFSLMERRPTLFLCVVNRRQVHLHDGWLLFASHFQFQRIVSIFERMHHTVEREPTLNDPLMVLDSSLSKYHFYQLVSSRPQSEAASCLRLLSDLLPFSDGLFRQPWCLGSICWDTCNVCLNTRTHTFIHWALRGQM